MGGGREGAARGEGRGQGAAWPARGGDCCPGLLGPGARSPVLLSQGRRLEMRRAMTKGQCAGRAPPGARSWLVTPQALGVGETNQEPWGYKGRLVPRLFFFFFFSFFFNFLFIYLFIFLI